MSAESNSNEKPRVYTMDNGIVATIEPKYSNMSTLILSGSWYKFLLIGRTMTEDVMVHDWEGYFGFKHNGKLDTVKKTFTCNVFHSEIEKDLSRLSTLDMINPDFE